jgi:hypothetical protein
MPIDNNDPAHVYVQQANRKEAQNRRNGDLRRARAKTQSPWWFVFSASLLGFVTVIYAQESNPATTGIFGLLTAVHVFLAYQQWKRRAEQ